MPHVEQTGWRSARPTVYAYQDKNTLPTEDTTLTTDLELDVEVHES